MAVVTPSGCKWLRSTSRSCSSQKGSLGTAASQRGSSRKVNCRASSSLFRSLGHTILPLYCSSLQTCSWWSQPQASVLGMPSFIALMCPMFNRGTWDMVSFNLTKVYGQSVLLSASSTSLWAALVGMCPHCNEAKDPFAPDGKAWHYQKECHVPSGFFYITPHPCHG